MSDIFDELKRLVGKNSEAVTYEKYSSIESFVRSLGEKFNGDKSKNTQLIVQYRFTERTGNVSSWCLSIHKGECKIQMEVDVRNDADVIIDADATEYLRLVNNGGNPMLLMLRKKLNISKGSVADLLKFTKCFDGYLA
ncbi:MAG: hypothetical protein GF344_18885 [Chitinivibrionales bacterium]|nr:hypothetical protein [Chitinivibrionales bacterium]